MPAESHSFKPTLGLMDATMIVAGSMIGSGIFIVSADIVRNVGSAGWLILVWLITGFMTLTAAVSYGELSGMFPKAGGQYVYLKEAYNPLVSFLYGWSFFAVIQTGTIAAVGVAFSKYAAYLIPALSEDNHYSPFTNRRKYLWKSNLFYDQCSTDCFHRPDRLSNVYEYTRSKRRKMDSEYFYFHQTAGLIRTDHRRIYCISSGSMACQLVGCLGGNKIQPEGYL